MSEADKNAAVNLAHEIGMSAEEFTSGGADILVQAFARHRAAHMQVILADAADEAHRIGVRNAEDDIHPACSRRVGLAIQKALLSLATHTTQKAQGAEMTDEQIKSMVDRFLNWKLPKNFNPDAGISFKAEFNEHTAHPMKHSPTGTNLFDAVQAEAMVRHMLGEANHD